MSIEAIINDPELARVAAQLELLKRRSIRITPECVDEAQLTLGQSRLGGAPDLPHGVLWPSSVLDVPTPSEGFTKARPYEPVLPPDKRIALPFIAQFRLSDLAPYDDQKLLPPSGMLYFFYNTVAYYSDTGAQTGSIHDNLTGYAYNVYDWGTPTNWRVLFYDGDGTSLVRTPTPDTVPPQARYSACRLLFASEWSLPHVETCFVGEHGSTTGKLVLSSEEWEVYAEACYEARANQRIHQMLGHSDDVQPAAMESSYLSIRSTFFPALPSYATLSPEAQQHELEQNRLLLQVDEANNGMRFGRGGRLFFFIRDADLAARDFSAVWATEQ